MFLATMAGKTADGHFVLVSFMPGHDLRHGVVDLLIHGDHLAGNLFVVLLIGSEVTLNVAERALNSERCIEATHNGDQFRRRDLQQLKVFRLRHRTSGFGRLRRGLLRKQHARCNQRE